MNVRFAEPCRDQPLELLPPETEIELASVKDGRTEKERLLTCQKDIFIGVFFDGTNNNKYRDTPGFAHTNVARLYEVYPGTPAAQTAPKFKPRIKPDGTKVERKVFADQLFRASSSVAPEDFPYYRKVYVPGLGTPMPDVGDSGAGIIHKTGGLAAALFGQVRLDWAMLQLLNQVHAAVFKMPLEPSIDIAALLKRREKRIQDKRPLERDLIFPELLDKYQQRLEAIVKQRGENLPHLRKIRLSVFGYSRGATAARAWVNMVTNRWGMGIAGIPLQIDFLGIFDTVASVGLAQSTPHFEGHGAWADAPYMIVPPTIKRCAHLVAALEVRASFPLDSVCQNNQLPSNCKEIVYPGVHSDVGGGYPPDDQGRALGQGAVGDQLKPSQISLAQMYREARMAGVPLVPESEMKDYRMDNFAIHPELRKDFNAYVEATRSGKVPPTQGKGPVPEFARLFPTETQPREELHRVIRRHYGIALRWRKAMMNRTGGVAALPGLQASQSELRYQDAEDFRGAEAELRKEILFLQDTNPKKFEKIDDTFFELILDTAGLATNVATFAALPIRLSLLAATWGTKLSLRDVMMDKQHQWDTWLHAEWADHGPNALPEAAHTWFEKYVHDSRAWFKPFMRSDVKSKAADDEDWFVFGERDKEKAARTSKLKQDIAKHQKANDTKALAAAQQELKILEQDGQPLMVGGREPYRMWGYVRHRRLFYAGNINDASYATHQEAIEVEEAERVRQAQREELNAQENARHNAKSQRIKDDANERLKSGQVKEPDEYRRGVLSQLAAENRLHTEQLTRIEKQTAAPVTAH